MGGRSCGECTVCCTALVVDSPAFRKVGGVACSHCTTAGCAIHATRYPVCRAYFCGWINAPELDDAWRPDRSGVIVMPRTADTSHGRDSAEGVEFLVTGGVDAVSRSGFAQAVLSLISGGIPVFLGVPGPSGFYPARMQLNEALASLAQRRDTAGAVRKFCEILHASRHHTFEPVAF